MHTQKVKKFLTGAGICAKTGKLRKPYRDDPGEIPMRDPDSGPWVVASIALIGDL